MSDDLISMLGELDAFEVSLVDRGANQKRPFPIHKKEKPMSMDAILKAVLGTKVDAEDRLSDVIKDLSEEGKAAIIALARTVTSFSDEIDADAIGKALEVCGVKIAKANSNPKPDVLANVPAEVRKQMEPLVKQLEAERALIEKDRALIEKERDDRARASWVTKAETDLSHLPGESAKDIGDGLYELHKVNPELAEKQFERMKAASDAIKNGELLKAKGHGNDIRPASSAFDAIQKAADDIVIKSGGKMSITDALSHVARTNPDLYDAYKREVSGK